MLLINAIAGALIVVAISFLSRTSYYYIAGLVPLFPTFTLIAHYAVGSQRTTLELKHAILFSMWSLIPYMLYLACSYYLIDKMQFQLALACSVVVWIAAAGILVWVRPV